MKSMLMFVHSLQSYIETEIRCVCQKLSELLIDKKYGKYEKVSALKLDRKSAIQKQHVKGL